MAAFSLAMFLRAFEEDLSDLVMSDIEISELYIQIALFEELPEDLKQHSLALGMEEALNTAQCAITRPTSFQEAMPTFVVLGNHFMDNISFGDNTGLSLQFLFAKALIEIINQLFKGEIDEEIIRPKVVSLVGKACP